MIKRSVIRWLSVCASSPLMLSSRKNSMLLLKSPWHPPLLNACPHSPHRCCSSGAKELEQTWNLNSLQKEVSRQHYRAVKKLNIMADRKIHDGEECQFVDKKEKLLVKVQSLLSLETQLKTLKSLNKTDEHYHDIMHKVQTLQIYLNTGKPKHYSSSYVQKPKKKIQPQPRQIFYAYLSADNIPIHVGKQATDNDELSCNPKYRDDAEWWLHADGCAGSHVVIKSTDNDIKRKFPQTVTDAAILAAFRSKNKLKASCDVKLTRCRNVKKLPGSPAGQVLLTDLLGKKIQINMKKCQDRFKALETERLSRQ